ncbi:hypothetical protein EYZ11_012009 [Aspergillus tanneri]|uniref:Uncharacterized protein n=1 Tax=Aspergillus tanneri TaxID=1220188 RepID=A0A4S3J3G9_9EURO|nr:hypothetical protein EYZ11_012009 [Aspergillus tanneri]
MQAVTTQKDPKNDNVALEANHFIRPSYGAIFV